MCAYWCSTTACRMMKVGFCVCAVAQLAVAGPARGLLRLPGEVHMTRWSVQANCWGTLSCFMVLQAGREVTQQCLSIRTAQAGFPVTLRLPVTWLCANFEG